MPTIEEMNRTIAEFMGCTQSFDTYYNPIGKFHFELKEAEYHSSWEWLMPVIENISKMPLIDSENYADVCYPITFAMPTEDGHVMFRFKGFSLHSASTLIEAAHHAVYEVAEFSLKNK